MKRAIALAIAVLLGTASAAVFYVHPESSQNCIQNCLDACCNCDTVLVGPGTYYENIVWPDSHGIKLISEYGRDTTFIDGGDSGQVIWMGAAADSSTAVCGFTIQNGYTNSADGGGIGCFEYCTPLIEGNRFEGNVCAHASRGGGGVGCYHASPRVRNNHFEGNQAVYGGGISVLYSSPELTGNTIVENWAAVKGGGIACGIGASPVIRHNIIEGDSAYGGGGIYLENGCNPLIAGNTVRDNLAVNGAGIYMYLNCSPTIEFCTISGNSPDGVVVESGGEVQLRWNSVAGNGRHGVWSVGGEVTAAFNWWGDETGPYHHENPGGQGDTISGPVDFRPWLGSDVVHYVHPDSTDNTIQAALDACADNEAVCVGPGTYVENLVWPNTQGIRLASQVLNPDSVVIDGDSAGHVIDFRIATDTTTYIHGLTIRNGLNPPERLGGGGIFCEFGSPTISGNVFTGNRTREGGFAGGGILCYHFADPNIVDNLFTGNWSANGAAICCFISSSPLILNNDIIGNQASPGSGGIEMSQTSSPVVRGNTIEGNRGGWGGGINVGIQCRPVIDRNTFRHDTAHIGGAMNLWSTDTALITGNLIEYCVADSFGSGIFTEMNSAPVIRSCTIMHCFAVTDSDGGIGCATNSAPDIDSCKIASNVPHGVVVRSGALPAINACDIYGNSGHGVLHITSGPDTIDATNNWWGHTTGPFHPTLNPGGLGDSVSDYVYFVPWDTEPPVGFAEPRNLLTPVRQLEPTFVRSVIDLAPGKAALLLDITGRRVADLAPGVNDIRHISPGVYFLRRQDKPTTVRKVIVTR